ncbi:MAG TPA: hypothetical protein VJ867_04455 [Gemmatimonadaceae bacterium]|nr:hypothetical protein [Gemmatimonadaceae bacterium]
MLSESLIRRVANILGAVACVLITAWLYISKYGLLQEGYSSPAPGAFTPFIIGVAVVLVLLCFTRAGRAFTLGFVAALIVLTIVTRGRFTSVWADPIVYAHDSWKYASMRRASARRATEAERHWRDSVRAAGIDRAEGARRVVLMGQCLERGRAFDTTNALPADSITVSRAGLGCRNWDGYFRGGRTGWLWRYTPARAGSDLRIDIYPDPMLDIAGPIFSGDSRGLVLMRETADADAHQYFSVPQALRAVRDCINRAPASAGRATLQRLAANVCADLELRPLQPNEDMNLPFAIDSNVVSLMLPHTATGWGVITRYALRYVQTGPMPSDGFSLYANPAYYRPLNVRAFALLQDGSFHVTTENRVAAATDPAPLACELDLSLACPPAPPAGPAP